MLATVQESELDRGTASLAPGAERHCALSRQLKPAHQMIRFVLGPDGDVVADVKRKLPGRGLWITGTKPAIEEAAKRNVFARGFKRDVRVAPDLAESTEHMLERAALDALAIMAKAGRVAAGFGKVEAAIGRDDILALIHAADAGADGKRKLDTALHRSRGENAGGIAIVDLFTGTQLDLALNRPNVVHAALLAGPGSETFLARVGRLAHFRTGNSTDTAGDRAPRGGGARGQHTE